MSKETEIALSVSKISQLHHFVKDLVIFMSVQLTLLTPYVVFLKSSTSML